MKQSDAHGDAHGSEKRDRRDSDIQVKVRSYRIIGMTAGILTTVVIAAAGYLAINYIDNRFVPLEPSMPAMVVSADPTGEPDASDPAQIGTTEPQEEEKTTAPSNEAQSSVQEEPPEADSSESAEEPTEESMENSAEESIESSAETSTEESAGESEEESTEEKETLSPEEEADRELRMKAIEKFDNLGIVVNVRNYLNLRTGPSTDYDICGKIFRYCGVNVLSDEGNGWYKVESGGVTGYVAQQYILQGEEAVELALEHCRYQAEVKSETVSVKKEPSDSSEQITVIKEGDRYDILSYSGDWVEIEAVEALSGYVPVETISAAYRLEEAVVFGYDDSISQLRIDIINTGFEYYGGKYVFGGTSLTEGVDCSSYTQQIYGMFGIKLERNSYVQCEQGVEVAEEDIRPGDLVFYVGRVPGMVGHVAIYIGNGKILHAASEAKGICVSDWKFVPIVTIRNVIGD